MKSIKERKLEDFKVEILSSKTKYIIESIKFKQKLLNEQAVHSQEEKKLPLKYPPISPHE